MLVQTLDSIDSVLRQVLSEFQHIFRTLLVKQSGFHIRLEEYKEAFEMIEKILDDTADIQTFLNRETQD